MPMRVFELRGEWPYEGDESVENISWFIWRMSIHFPKLETLGVLESMYGPINTLQLSIHSPEARTFGLPSSMQEATNEFLTRLDEVIKTHSDICIIDDPTSLILPRLENISE